MNAWLQLNGDCIDVIQGDPVYLFIYIDITDITEQKVLQKKLEERSELLRNALEMAERPTGPSPIFSRACPTTYAPP